MKVQENGKRKAIWGVVLGALMGLGGLAAGTYAQIIKPLLVDGAWRQLSLGTLVGGVALLLGLGLGLASFLAARMRRKSAAPDAW